ncbi:MAG: hypothetical protein SH868_04890 [Bythopirellula sp.]|nr:hypothetical protein [Bythopirellula sp.]
MMRLVVCLLSVGLFMGCRGSVDPHEAVAEANATNLQRLANLYVAYQSENNWQGPADEAKFKEFLRTFNPKKLARIGIDSATTDQLFISERDGQPFKIRYGVVGNMMGSTEPVIFEAEGVDGKRMVGLLNMSQLEVEAAEYDSLWAGKGPAAQPVRQLP